MIKVQDKIYQWSVDVPVYVSSSEVVQFAQVGSDETINVEPKAFGGSYVCTIPNVLLQEARDIFIYSGGDGVLYADAIDLPQFEYRYTETDEPLPDDIASEVMTFAVND